jgi:hypothetical protein
MVFNLSNSITPTPTHDVSLLNSAWSGPDDGVVFEMNGNVIKGLDAIRTQIFDVVGPMDTTHMISNVRVDVKDGASTASLAAYAMAQHCPPGRGTEPDGPKFTTGSTYSLNLVKDESDGLWKIKKFAMKVIWRQGDRSVMQRPS